VLQRTSPLVRESLVAAWPSQEWSKKLFCSDYPRGLINCLWLGWFPAFDVLPVRGFAHSVSVCPLWWPGSLLRFHRDLCRAAFLQRSLQ